MSRRGSGPDEAPTPFDPLLRPSGRVREIQSLAAFDALVSAGDTSMDGWRLQDLDLTARGRELALLDPRGSILFGCTLAPADEQRLRSGGAVIFPTPVDLPFRPYRSGLYTAEELYDSVVEGGDYADSTDARCYAFAQGLIPRPGRHPDIAATLAMAIHDDAITDAFDEVLDALPDPRRVVGVMGGHALERGSTGYREAALLGHDLAEHGLVVLTGGGPGAMEATNLGASCPAADLLDPAIAQLANVPSFRPSMQQWAVGAIELRRQLLPEWPGLRPGGNRSLAVPTWFYGHEPPNVFNTGIAKFFSNPLREDLLLGRAQARRRRPARRGRHGAGALPAGEPALLRRGSRRRCARWCSSASSTGPRPCPSGRCCGRWPSTGRWQPALHLVETAGEACALVTDRASRPGLSDAAVSRARRRPADRRPRRCPARACPGRSPPPRDPPASGRRRARRPAATRSTSIPASGSAG